MDYWRRIEFCMNKAMIREVSGTGNILTPQYKKVSSPIANDIIFTYSSLGRNQS